MSQIENIVVTTPQDKSLDIEVPILIELIEKRLKKMEDGLDVYSFTVDGVYTPAVVKKALEIYVKAGWSRHSTICASQYGGWMVITLETSK
jgi:hypothetical protein